MNPTAKRIAENLAAVRDRIAQAAARSGRTADAIRLVAVTKYVGPDLIRPLVEAGAPPTRSASLPSPNMSAPT